MQKQTIKLTAEKFQDIYTDEKFRNQVAGAHRCSDQFGNFKHMQTCSYPTTWIVTPEQISLAKVAKERAKTELLQKMNSEEYDNVLVFVGMGMSFDNNYKGNNPTHTENMRASDVYNHRIRTNLTVKGEKYFIEFLTDRNGLIWVDFSIHYKRGGEKVYNFGRIERGNTPGGKYTKDNILKIVNNTFNAKFTRVEIDETNLCTDDFVSRSV